MEDKRKQMIVQCYHCGNNGLMNVEHEINQQFGGDYENEFGDYQHDFEEHITWKLLSCPVCHLVTLYQIYTDESMQVPYGEDFRQLYEEKIIYPENKMKMNDVPKEIASAFESALKIKNIDYNICLISLRRTLEMICNNKNAKGDSLYKKIINLIEEKIFPKELENAYFVIKDFGNNGAHGNNMCMNQYEVDELIDILYGVIKYLYIMPKKIEKMKKTLEEKSKVNKNG